MTTIDEIHKKQNERARENIRAIAMRKKEETVKKYPGVYPRGWEKEKERIEGNET